MAETKSNRGGQNFIDLTGKRFGMLLVIEQATKGSNGKWLCLCDCGNTKQIAGTTLRGRVTQGCGCARKASGKRRTIDLTGQTFNRLTVIAQDGSNAEGKALWQCRCECGQTVIVIGKALRRGTTKSCGCWKRDTAGNRTRTHGLSGTSEHKAWKAAKDRCFNPKCKNYENWGGRGITMCEEWTESFESFLAHIGPRPRGRYSIDRIDNEKGYEPGNVRWATASQQNYNRRPKRWIRKPLIQ